ncbi:MAG: hypothetical protein QHJ73_00845, partial [Armatimonadota bacterium]|nr:hypothetical protein [Armatimonadota bacterium]
VPTQPVQPPLPPADPVVTPAGEILIEAETGRLGADMARWSDDPAASGGWYVAARPGTTSLTEPPPARGQAVYTFTVARPTVYLLEARVLTPTVSDDSFWVRVDDGPWIAWTRIGAGNTWRWVAVRDGAQKDALQQFALQAGTHTVVFAIREDGAGLDQIRLKPK